MILRLATAEDLSELSELKARAAWQNVKDRSLLAANPDLARTIEPGLELRVVEEDGAILSFIGTRLEADTVEIVELFTDPTHMGRGYASQLVKEVQENAAGRRITVDANPEAVDLYRAMGFSPSGALGGDGLAMEWHEQG